MSLLQQIKIILTLSLLAVLFLSGIYLFISISPWICTGIVLLLLLAAIHTLQKEKISNETYDAFLNFLVSPFSRAKKRYHWRGIYTDGITVFLMAAMIFTIISPLIIKLPEFRADLNAKIGAAVKRGAHPVEINGFCVDKKVYIKDDKGNWVYLTVQDKSLE